MGARLGVIAATIGVTAIITALAHLNRQPTDDDSAGPGRSAPAVGMPGAPPTSASGLRERIAEMDTRLQSQPEDTAAAVLLADALLRQARASGDARATGRATTVLESVLHKNPGHYDALKMLGAVYLSQHRFREALETGRRARDLRPEDAWNYGVMGDALIELGEYEAAFDAIDAMASMRPNAAAYGRVAYARELRGDLEGALAAMQMADAATSSQDPEAQAWYASQLGELYLQMGQVPVADREFRRAVFIFPDYPLATLGLGKVASARGDREKALELYLELWKRMPTLDLAARIGDLHAQIGDSDQAERYYQLAEDAAGPGIAQTEADLALFLAERNRRLLEAVTIAEAVAAKRHDIFTDDALAWAYYKAGRVEDALAASERALRTGTRDARIQSHAFEIRRAAGRPGD